MGVGVGVGMGKSEDNLQKSIFSSYHVGPEN